MVGHRFLDIYKQTSTRNTTACACINFVALVWIIYYISKALFAQSEIQLLKETGTKSTLVREHTVFISTSKNKLGDTRTSKLINLYHKGNCQVVRYGKRELSKLIDMFTNGFHNRCFSEFLKWNPGAMWTIVTVCDTVI